MTDQEVFDIAALIHHEWSQEMRNLENVKRSKDDGSPDWVLFREDMLKNHTAKAENLANLKKAFLAEHPLSI